MQLHIFMVEDAILQKEVLGTLHVLAKKTFILLKLKIMLRSFLGVLIMLHFKFRGLILQKMFTVPKICIHFLRIFFHATPKIRTYHITKKIIIFKCSGI